MEVFTSGAGPPIVLIGGGLQGADSWGPLLGRLEATRKVIRLQNLNVEYGLKNRALTPAYSVRSESAAANNAIERLALNQRSIWLAGPAAAPSP